MNKEICAYLFYVFFILICIYLSLRFQYIKVHESTCTVQKAEVHIPSNNSIFLGVRNMSRNIQFISLYIYKIEYVKYIPRTLFGHPILKLFTQRF